MGKINYWAELAPQTVYHIYNHAVGDEKFFRSDENYRFFLERWQKYLGPYMSTYAYCLIPNHFHIIAKFKPLTPSVIRSIEKENTSKALAFLNNEVPIRTFYESQFKRLFTSYSKAYGKQYNRVGSLFRAKFKRVVLRNYEHFLEKLLYTHHNPIHHNMVVRYHDWIWSSFYDYFEVDADQTFVAIEAVLKQFGEKPREQLRSFWEAHEVYRENFIRN